MTHEAVAPCRVMAQVDAIAAPSRAPSRPVVATARPRRTGRHRRPTTAARHRAEPAPRGLGAVGVLDPTSGDHLVVDPAQWAGLIAAAGTDVVFAIPDTGALEVLEGARA